MPAGDSKAQVRTIRGIEISYEILGSGSGTPIVITPGGGGGSNALRWLAQKLKHGRRVLIWDRPNCGASGLTFDSVPGQPEPDLQADFLHELLHELGMVPAVCLGKSNGARLSLIMASKYPADVAAVVCLNVTSGHKAARKLSKDRYFKFVDICTTGGMEEVAKDEHFRNLFEKNEANRARLLATDPALFMARMRSWGDFLQRAGDPQRYPVTGLDVDLLRSIQHDALLCYINDPSDDDDGMHTLDAIKGLHACLPNARPLIATGDKDVWTRAVNDFVKSLVPGRASSQARVGQTGSSTAAGEVSEPAAGSAAGAQGPSRVICYSSMAHGEDQERYTSYYSEVAETRKKRKDQERRSYCYWGGLFDRFYLGQR